MNAEKATNDVQKIDNRKFLFNDVLRRLLITLKLQRQFWIIILNGEGMQHRWDKICTGTTLLKDNEIRAFGIRLEHVLTGEYSLCILSKSDISKNKKISDDLIREKRTFELESFINGYDGEESDFEKFKSYLKTNDPNKFLFIDNYSTEFKQLLLTIKKIYLSKNNKNGSSFEIIISEMKKLSKRDYLDCSSDTFQKYKTVIEEHYTYVQAFNTINKLDNYT